MRVRQVPKKRDIDFFAALRRQEHRGRGSARRRALLRIGGAAVILAVAAGVHGTLVSWQISDLKEEISRNEDYLAAPANAEKFGERAQMRASRDALMRYNQKSERYIEVLEGTRRLSSVDFDQVEAQRPSNVTVERYTFDGDTMEIACVSADKDAPARYAENLTGAGVFEEVGYSGFQYRKVHDGSVYAFTVTCRLWNPAGEEAAP